MVLTLTRSGTVYSMIQLEEQAGNKPERPSSALGLSTTPLRAVTELRGSLLPAYHFPSADGFASKRIRSFGDLQGVMADTGDSSHLLSSSEDDNTPEGSSDSGSSAAQVVPQRSLLDALLLAEWEDRAEQGLFRYDVTACPTRVLPGPYGFVAQLNEGRASKKRPTEFLVDQVEQPFDASKFHFGKALQQEVLFQFQPSAVGRAPSFASAAPAADSPNLLFINVSPIEYGHVLLVPRALDNLNQLVSPETALLALQFAREGNNPYLRVGFNSLGAYGTINHLHFQAYYLAAPMALERAPTVPLHPAPAKCRKRGVQVCELAGYPVRGLVFEAGDSLVDLAEAVGSACQRLSAANVPHNMMIVDRGARVFLLPNAFAKRKARGELPEDIMDSMVDPAVFEISGHIVLKRQEDYDKATQEWAWRLLEYATLPEERFREVVGIALGKTGLV